MVANSTFLWPYKWPLDWPFWSDFFTEGVVLHDQVGKAKKPKPKWVRFMSLLELLLPCTWRGPFCAECSLETTF